jgi:cob(I)alamin adenosyltransferase
MDKPMKLYQAYLRNTVASPNNDIPLNLISQEQYLRTGSKGSTGTPNSVYMEVLRDYSVAHLYTTPDLIASGIYQAHLLVQRPLQDVGAVTNNMDFPQEWLYALGWNLASELIEDYEVPEGKANRVMMKAAKYLQEVEDFDTEYNSVYMSPSQYRPSI